LLFTAATVAAPDCSCLEMPKRSARALSLSGSYSCNVSPRVALKSIDLTSDALTAFGARPGVDFVLGLGGSTRAMPKRAARALRFSNSSSSAEVAGTDTGVLGTSGPLLAAFWTLDFGLA
jgi:hypothetical protein